jgi:hypothetical protein
VKAIVIVAGLSVACGGLAAQPFAPMQTVRSGTGQFIVRAPAISTAETRSSREDRTLIEFDPNILAITCERIKQALLWELTMPDLWRGRIYIEVSSALATNQAPIIMAKPYLDGWQYQMELPRRIEKPKFVRGLIQVLLLEIANRNAGLHSAEIPLWLSEGLSQHLVNSSEVDLVLPQPQGDFNHVNVSWQARQGRRRDPLIEARARLETHAAPTFAKLGGAFPEPVPDETWKTFQASAQLFVSQLLSLPNGRPRLVEMLYELPYYLNWQSAFLNAYRADFPRLLDVEKWWAIVLVHFAGQDPSQTWSIPMALQKLDDTLHPPALVSADRKDMPHRAKLSVQQVITDWDYLRQRIVLKELISRLLLVRLKSPPELGSLVDAYRAAIDSYLNRRDRVGITPSLPGRPATRADWLVRGAVNALNDLDEKRAASGATNAPPGNSLAQTPK